MQYCPNAISRADLGWAVLEGMKHPPLKFYCVHARKLLEAAVQMQMHLIYVNGVMK